MDPISAVGSYSNLSALEIGDAYAMRLTKMAMDDAQELALQELEQMLPPSPYTFDVYA